MKAPVNEAGAIDMGWIIYFWHPWKQGAAPKLFDCDVSQCLFCAHLHDLLAGVRADPQPAAGPARPSGHESPAGSAVFTHSS